jgi:four helix bundle protein
MAGFRLEDLLVWQRAIKLTDAVSAITRSGNLARDERLRRQTEGAAESVLANIAEGYGQASDKAFASYLFISRGSANELRAHLRVAVARGYLLEGARAEIDRELEEIARMLTGLVRYLLRSDRKHRC